MPAEVYLDHISFALGPVTQTLEQAAAKGLLVSSPAALREAGFGQHHMCATGTSAFDLARAAVEPIRAAASLANAMIYSTCIPANGNVGDAAAFTQTRDVKYLMDFPASRLQAVFGLEKALIIGLSQQACTGLLGALRLARSLILSEPGMASVLCLTSDRFPPGALYEQSYNLISDGAAACVVSLERSGFRLLSAHGITNGAMAGASDDETVGSYFTYAHRVIQETLEKANLTLKDLAWIIPQNMNIKAWQILSRLLPFDLSRVSCPSLPDVAHMISGDNLINLKRLTDDGRIQKGDKLLLFMAGYGLTWQAVILERQ